LTDLPYCEKDIGLFADLAVAAARVLRPGGLCLTYSGNLYLPSVYANLGHHLQYLWTFNVGHARGFPRVFKTRVRQAWKPVLGFGKPPIDAWWDWPFDAFSAGQEKNLHDWQQSVAEAKYFVHHFCPAGGLVLDPCLGSGTTGVAAVELGRRFLGIDIEEACVKMTAARLAELSSKTELDSVAEAS
jgi:site-specific DNA-methyltransferase (adenine-specific)